jgi:hypothetical protein
MAHRGLPFAAKPATKIRTSAALHERSNRAFSSVSNRLVGALKDGLKTLFIQ